METTTFQEPYLYLYISELKRPKCMEKYMP